MSAKRYPNSAKASATKFRRGLRSLEVNWMENPSRGGIRL